jgi:hypothetical protein
MVSDTSSPPKFSSMSVNERLRSVNLLDHFDTAVREGNAALMKVLLNSVGFGVDAEELTDTILAHPTRYGRLPSRQD